MELLVRLNMHKVTNNGTKHADSDIVFTPPHIADEIITRFRPQGKVLDPCRGDGAFFSKIPGCEWAEIAEGRDFFQVHGKFDWVVGNPPYSILNKWLEHSFEIADHVLYLLPVAKVFGSQKRLNMIREYGGIVEVYAKWTGRQIGFPFGWACGAVHISRGYSGGTIFST